MLKRSFTPGFTLIELLVVISIIAMFAAIILAALSTARAKARDAKRITDMHEIVTALELYAADNGGKYPLTPVSDSGTAPANCGGSTPSCVDDVTSLTPKYIPTLPFDPKSVWAGTTNNYRYCSNGNDFNIVIRTEVDVPANYCQPVLSTQNPTSCPAWNTTYGSC